MIRPLIAFCGFIGALFLPAWVPLVCILLLSLRFRAWEALLVGLALDFVWLPQSPLHEFPLYTFLALAIVWILEPLRVQLLQ